MKRLLVMAACLVGLASSLSAQSEQEIDSWLRGLDSDQFSVREQSTRQLAKAKSQHLRRMILHTENASAEANYRLTQVIKSVLDNSEIEELEATLATLRDLEQHPSRKVRELAAGFHNRLGHVGMVEFAKQYRTFVDQALQEKDSGETHPDVITESFVTELKKAPGVQFVGKDASSVFLERPDRRWETGDADEFPRILIYRVKWFKGGWSRWFIPGVNDPDSKDATKLMWRYFYDHEFEYVELNAEYGPLSRRSTLLQLHAEDQ